MLEIRTIPSRSSTSFFVLSVPPCTVQKLKYFVRYFACKIAKKDRWIWQLIAIGGWGRQSGRSYFCISSYNSKRYSIQRPATDFEPDS